MKVRDGEIHVTRIEIITMNSDKITKYYRRQSYTNKDEKISVPGFPYI